MKTPRRFYAQETAPRSSWGTGRPPSRLVLFTSAKARDAYVADDPADRQAINAATARRRRQLGLL